MSVQEWAARRPRLSEENQTVYEVWDFCGCCWKPEALPVALAFYDVVDIEFLMQQLKLIRDRVAAWERAKREAEKGRR